MSNPSPGTGIKSAVVASLALSRRIPARRLLIRATGAALARSLGAADLTATLAGGIALGAAATEWDAAGIIIRPCAFTLTGKIKARLARIIGLAMVPT